MSDEDIFIGYSISNKIHKVYNKRTLVIEESMHVVFDESNISYLRNDDENQTRKEKQTGSNDQTQTKNLSSIEEQEGYSFELNIEENESHSMNFQNQETPTKEMKNMPREWNHQPNYPNEYIIGDFSQGVRTRSS